MYENFRLDLLAKEPYSGKAVIFEAKMGDKDLANQLLTYRKLFDSPLLVGVTEKRLKTFSKGRKCTNYFPQKFDEDLKNTVRMAMVPPLLSH